MQTAVLLIAVSDTMLIVIVRFVFSMLRQSIEHCCFAVPIRGDAKQHKFHGRYMVRFDFTPDTTDRN